MLRVLSHVVVLVVGVPAWAHGNLGYAQQTFDESGVPSLKHALDEFRRTVNTMRMIRFELVCHEFVTTPNHAGEYQAQVERTSIGMDRQRWKVVKRSESIVPSNDESAADEIYKEKQEIVFDEYELVAFDPSGVLPIDAEKVPVVVTVDFDTRANLTHRLDRLGKVGCIFGRLPGDGGQFIWDVVLSSDAVATIRAAKIQGVPTVYIHAKGPYGTHELWLDPENGYLPRQIKVVKVGSDLLDQTKLRDTPILQHPHPVWLNQEIASVKQTISDVRIEHVGNSPLIVGFVRWSVRNYVNGQSVSIRQEVRLNDMEVNPVFPPDYFTMTTHIPDGTVITCPRQPQLGFEWQNGQLVPLVNDELVTRIEELGQAITPSQEVMPERSRARFILLGNIIIIVVLILIIWAMRHWKTRQSVKSVT